MNIVINNIKVGSAERVYFIADLAANHDGDIERAKYLITLAKTAGADAVKFQHFDAKKFVSASGFNFLGDQKSHQSGWKKTVYEIYEEASLPLTWTETLKEHCLSIGVTFFSSPYGLDMVDHLDEHIPAWKIGSGDINYRAQLIKVAKTGKPVMLATGASTLAEVIEAVETLKQHTDKIVLMQCNTNYTGADKNYDYINLNVLETYKTLFPNVILGLSDHTFGHETVLGAIALGARVIEKHFTDEPGRTGPDHAFSMTPTTWKKMVDSARILERSLGSTIKDICENEKETVILQRRALYAIDDFPAGTHLDRSMFEAKRPALPGLVNINYDFMYAKLRKPLSRDTCLREDHLE